MKKIYLFIAISASFITTQAQTFEWAKREGLWAYDYGYGITTDYAGNVYCVGKYEEVNANFSGTLVPCEGNHDIFVVKYSPNGDLGWIRTAGGITGDYATSVATDNTYLYVAGEIEALGQNETIVFPGSSITLNCMGANDIYLSKYDLDGTLLWAERAGGYGYEKALGISYDAAGNVYICGLFREDATFGESTTIYATTNGVNDIFIAKYNADGVFQWVRKAGSTGRDEAKGIVCDAAGNCYITGMFSDNCTFGGTTLDSDDGFWDAFLAKYSTDGTLQWVKDIGGDYDDVSWGVTMANEGKIYIAGEFNSYTMFDNIGLGSSGMADVFVACYDAAGSAQWATSGGGPDGVDKARGLGTDGTNLYITGQFGFTAAFGSTYLTAADSSDIFIAKLNNAGFFVDAIAVDGVPDTFEELGYESGSAIAADASGNAFATGSLLNGGIFGTTSYGAYDRTDVFVTKVSFGGDASAPLAVSFFPLDNSIDVPNNYNIVLTFNETIQKGTGNIIIKEDGVVTQTIDVAAASVVVSGNTVTIDPADFTDSAVVNVEMASGVFKDMADNNYGGIPDATTWNFTIDDLTSITETSIRFFSIYPNPGTGNFTIDLYQHAGATETTVFNCLGQVVATRSDKASKILVDLSAEEKGIYFVQIKAGDQSLTTGKIVLQ